MQSTTPLMTQYSEMKAAYNDAVLLFQMGDFFECFGEDAITVSQVLGIVLTSRDKKKDAKPMAGFPIKALEEYLPKLVAAGYKVAVARQMELPNGKGIVKRAVTEVITQGTITTHSDLLSQDKNYLLAITASKNHIGIAFTDVTTGELKVFQDRYNPEKFAYLIEKLAPREIIISSKSNLEFLQKANYVIQPLPDSFFDIKSAEKILSEHFNVHNIDAIGLSSLDEAAMAAGAIISYVRETKKTDPKHITRLDFWNPNQTMIIDPITQRNLEIFYNLRTHKLDGSLMQIIDRTITPMGHRLLFEWVTFPLINKHNIEKRLDSVEYFTKLHEQLSTLREEFKNMPDLERLPSLIGLGRIHPKQIVLLKHGMIQILSIIKILQGQKLPELLSEKISSINIAEVQKAVDSIENTLVDSIDNPEESGIFNKGYNEKLDELILLAHDGNKLIKDIFNREKEASGISNLRLGFNRVFGYFFETSRGNAKLIPEHFIKKQTLVNTDRYITEEVKVLEQKVLGAQDNLAILESNLYQEYIASLQSFIPELRKVSDFAAVLDVITALAHLAVSKNFTRPNFVEDSETIKLIETKHPVVESKIADFVPNSISIERERNFIILTGPNMGGKSTFVRQIALIHLIAQIGSYVPAKEASIHIVDRVFARIGASDDISSGKSTFMVELSEVANIIKNATEKSLVILDEVGRGTSTYEGIALAWAISEYIIKHIKCTTIFTTHFRELTELEKYFSSFINYKVNIHEENNNIYFLHTITPGISDKSYGIQVAKLVDLPEEIITQAIEVLDRFEEIDNAKPMKKYKYNADQLSFASSLATSPVNKKEKEIITELKDIDTDTLSPIEALTLLADLKNRLSKD